MHLFNERLIYVSSLVSEFVITHHPMGCIIRVVPDHMLCCMATLPRGFQFRREGRQGAHDTFHFNYHIVYLVPGFDWGIGWGEFNTLSGALLYRQLHNPIMMKGDLVQGSIDFSLVYFCLGMIQGRSSFKPSRLLLCLISRNLVKMIC